VKEQEGSCTTADIMVTASRSGQKGSWEADYQNFGLQALTVCSSCLPSVQQMCFLSFYKFIFIIMLTF